MHSARRFLLILGCVLLAAAAANAQTVVFGNLNSQIKGYFPIGPIYASFSTGSGAVNLTDVQLKLESLDGMPNGFSVGLYADSSTTPGNLIQTLGSMQDSAISGSGATYDFPVSPGIALAPNTRYWIGLASGTGSATGWALTGSTAGTGAIASEFYCIELPDEEQPTARHAARPRGIPDGCFPNTQDPFVMQVTVSTAAASAPALSFTGITLLSLLLAASAGIFLRRSQPRAS